jgi:hypothetical protein
MANVLTTASTIKCAHGGQVTPLMSTAKLTVSGKPVLLANQVSGWVIPPGTCSQVGTGRTPCTSVTSYSQGAAGKLTAGGVPVLLDSGIGMTNGAPVNTVTVSALQSEVTGT